MLTEKMKEVQLVAESKVLKIDPVAKLFSRFDKTVYIKEAIPTAITVTGDKPQYVEAAKFFALMAEVTQVDLLEDCCHLTLRNGAEYKLPYFMLGWEDQNLDTTNCFSTRIKLAAGRLSSATLKNLANPMLQCIYIDDATAVSCNSMVACIDGTVESTMPLLLPPDVINFIEGQEVELQTVTSTDSQGNVHTTYVFNMSAGTIYVPAPELDYKETADTLRAALPENINRYPLGTLFDSLKRLSASHEMCIFKKDRVVAGEDFEPFDFPSANPKMEYNIQNLLSVMQQAKNIAQSEYALLLYGDQFLFMVSPEEAPDDGQTDAEE
ncbi:MAG: hypothetical protein NC218_01480 [Acetobacter sp.]|nr:hypothetical protein [Acetobacter sp.]